MGPVEECGQAQSRILRRVRARRLLIEWGARWLFSGYLLAFLAARYTSWPEV